MFCNQAFSRCLLATFKVPNENDFPNFEFFFELKKQFCKLFFCSSRWLP